MTYGDWHVVALRSRIMSRRSPPHARFAQKKPVQNRNARTQITPAQFQQLADQFRKAMAAQDYATGVQLARRALEATPNNITVLGDYALCLMRIGAHEDAYRVYRQVHDAPPELRAKAAATWLDGLAEVCGWLGRTDEVRQYGSRSLREADERYRHGERWPLPATAPAFNAQAKERNIIAYSLFGAQPRYCESAVMNARIAHELFPAWTCRVYLDNSVPAHVKTRLRAAGAQVVDMDHHPYGGIPATLWRFLVMDDPQVDRFLVRDADALLSEREVSAVDAWIASGRLFHHIRDYFTHTELLLAGLWGGCTGVLPPIAPKMRAYTTAYRGATRFTDQAFLREVLWPSVRENILNHDDLFGFHGAEPLPAHAPLRWEGSDFHVGSNAAYRSVGGKTTAADGTTVRVEFSPSNESPFCYTATVHNGEWQLGLPFFMVDEIEAQRLHIRALAADGVEEAGQAPAF